MKSNNTIYSNIPRSDPLEFYSNHGLDFNRVSKFLDLDTNELSKLGGVSKKSVRLDELIPQELSDRLGQIASICGFVAEYFDGDKDKTALWFKTPNLSLGGITPRDMIRFGRYKKLLNFILEAREANANGGS